MSSSLHIYLVRHGESAANLDKRVNIQYPDHEVPLSLAGIDQARAAGAFLAGDYWGSHMACALKGRIGVYTSPYKRTRQTWQNFSAGMQSVDPSYADLPVTESIFLRELEFGLFDGIADEDLPVEFPREYAYYEKHKRFQGEFYARMPSGESRCDVAQRVHQFIVSLRQDAERLGLEHVIIISHGVTVRTFVMQWLGLSVEWMEQERNPANGSIRLLSDDGEAYIYAGAPRLHAPTAQDLREADQI